MAALEKNYKENNNVASEDKIDTETCNNRGKKHLSSAKLDAGAGKDEEKKERTPHTEDFEDVENDTGKKSKDTSNDEESETVYKPPVPSDNLEFGKSNTADKLTAEETGNFDEENAMDHEN